MMNGKERKDTIEQILKGLVELPETWTHFLKLKASPDKDIPIKDIVNDMPDKTLVWALTYINQSLKKLNT